LPLFNPITASIGNKIINGTALATLTVDSNGNLSQVAPDPFMQQFSGIDATTGGAVSLFTTENNGRRFIVVSINVVCTAANTASVGASVSIGTNSASYNNIVAIAATSLTSANTFLGLTILPVSIAPNTAVKVNITTPAIAISQSLRVDLVGYYS
jgi:hypothetical protein